MAICSRSSFCDAFNSAAALSSLNHALFAVNTSLTFLSRTFNLSFKSFTVLVSTVSSVFSFSFASAIIDCCTSISPSAVPVLLLMDFSSLSMTAFCLSIEFFSLSILSSNICIRCISVSDARFCSRCAFERNPKIPMDVIKDSIITAVVR